MAEDVSRARLARAIVTLLDEAVRGAEQGSVWFSDPKAGILDTMEGLSHQAASTPPGPGRRTIVAHLEHLRYSLQLVNRALRGEDAYATANWEESWAVQSADEAAWQRLRQAIEQEYRSLAEAVGSGDAWLENDVALTGTLANLVHVAYHLGAIRQIARSVGGTGAR